MANLTQLIVEKVKGKKYSCINPAEINGDNIPIVCSLHLAGFRSNHDF